MTVTFLDPPGPLPTRREVIDFVSTSGVLAVSVRFGDGAVEERAYRDGQWLYPYADSSGPASGAAGTYHLVRTGGWPRGFTVHVDEQIPPTPMPTGGQTWGVIYEVDFAAQPSQTIGAAGAYTIGGLTWWAKGLTTQVSTAVVNGAGLQFTNLSASNLLMPGYATAFTARHLFCPLGQVPGYAASGPTIVLARMTQSPSNGVGTSSGTWVGLISSTNDAISQLGSARASEAWAGIEQSTSKQIMWKLGGEGTSGASSAAGTGLGVAGVIRSHREFSLIVGSPWSGTWPAPSDLRTPVYNAPQSTMMYAIDPPARANPGIGLYLSTNSGMSGAVGTIHGVRILQPKVAA